jgi:hypothetical protein
MTIRAIATALLFGSLGGGLPGLLVGVWSSLDPGADSTAQARLMILVGAVVIGALVGTAFAIPALIVAAIAADVAAGHGPWRSRVTGMTAAVLITVGAHFLVFRTFSIYPVALGFGAYAALVAWLRLPWILAVSPAGTGSSLSPLAK